MSFERLLSNVRDLNDVMPQLNRGMQEIEETVGRIESIGRGARAPGSVVASSQGPGVPVPIPAPLPPGFGPQLPGSLPPLLEPPTGPRFGPQLPGSLPGRVVLFDANGNPVTVRDDSIGSTGRDDSIGSVKFSVSGHSSGFRTDFSTGLRRRRRGNEVRSPQRLADFLERGGATIGPSGFEGDPSRFDPTGGASASLRITAGEVAIVQSIERLTDTIRRSGIAEGTTQRNDI